LHFDTAEFLGLLQQLYLLSKGGPLSDSDPEAGAPPHFIANLPILQTLHSRAKGYLQELDEHTAKISPDSNRGLVSVRDQEVATEEDLPSSAIDASVGTEAVSHTNVSTATDIRSTSHVSTETTVVTDHNSTKPDTVESGVNTDPLTDVAEEKVVRLEESQEVGLLSKKPAEIQAARTTHFQSRSVQTDEMGEELGEEPIQERLC
jgi:hypothetical protein